MPQNYAALLIGPNSESFDSKLHATNNFIRLSTRRVRFLARENPWRTAAKLTDSGCSDPAFSL